MFMQISDWYNPWIVHQSIRLWMSLANLRPHKIDVCKSSLGLNICHKDIHIVCALGNRIASIFLSNTSFSRMLCHWTRFLWTLFILLFFVIYHLGIRWQLLRVFLVTTCSQVYAIRGAHIFDMIIWAHQMRDQIKRLWLHQRLHILWHNMRHHLSRTLNLGAFHLDASLPNKHLFLFQISFFFHKCPYSRVHWKCNFDRDLVQ